MNSIICKHKASTPQKEFDHQPYLELNQTLNKHLIHWKNKINDNKCWDTAKRLSNTFEFIFSSGYNKVSVSKKKPLSRSYFKLWEILHDFDIVSNNMKSAHIAEGPGGFIECLCDFFNMYMIQGSMYGITLKSSNKKIPSWKVPRHLFESNDIHLYDYDDGNIYNVETINHFIQYVGEHSCDFVTSDGGFDFSADFNNQETDSLKLMISEIYISLMLQKEGGSMLLKVFDLFSLRTIKMVSLCSDFYDHFMILKPQTSRPANSEKYLLFRKNMNIYSDLQLLNLDILERCIQMEDESIIDEYTNYQDSLVALTKYNIVYTHNQISCLKETLEVSKYIDTNNKIIGKSISKNIDVCRDWCINYNIPINQQ